MNEKLFEAIRHLNLPLGHYLITGSGPMGIRELRKINDIDLLVSDELWEKLASQYGITEKNGIKKIVIGEIEAFGSKSFPEESGLSVTKRLEDAEMIEGLPLRIGILMGSEFLRLGEGTQTPLKFLSFHI